jgi:phospholipid/cholesterol/gamma-HCH transport system substrate-binding protein
MSPKMRNFAVGLTVMVSIAIFLWMFISFGTKSVSLFGAPQVAIEIRADQVDGLSEGSPLMYQGVIVGRILRLHRNDDGNGVLIDAIMDTIPPIPTNVSADIVTTSLISGGASLELVLAKGQPAQFAPPGTPFPPIKAKYDGLDLSDFGKAGTQIARAATEIADATDQVRQQQIVEHLNEAVLNFNAQVTAAGQVLKSIQDVAGDVKVQGDLRQTIANLAQATNDLPALSKQASDVLTEARTDLARTQGYIDTMNKQLGDGLTRASATLDSIHDLADKINNGKGTAGMLVNDPKMYQALVDDLRELNANELVLERLLQQWEQEGVSVDLKLK